MRRTTSITSVLVFILACGAAIVVSCATNDIGTSTVCNSDDDCGDLVCNEGLCGEGSQDGVTDTAGGIGSGDIESDSTGDLTSDGITDSTIEEGGYLAPCERQDDCISQICISSPIGRVCTKPCTTDEECEGAAGWRCRQVEGDLDLTQICYPDPADLCEPCTVDTDCGGLNDRCLNLQNGNFCGLDCTAGGQCPEGYYCESLTEDFIQCIPDEQRCGPCREADLMTDVNNCGDCNLVCETPNAVPQCREGRCEIDVCNAGWSNCDGDAETGCEVNIGNDANNCGACGVQCADEPCTNGSCGCPDGQIVCDGECRTPNVCGGCSDFDGRGEGDACGPCDEDELSCVDGDLVCDGNTSFNECGGCVPSDDELGESCGPCGLDEFICGENDSVVCGGETWANSCETCDDLGSQAPGQPCGPCGLDEYVCDDDGTTCDGQTFGNACNGCNPLAGTLGEDCGRCNEGTRTCDGTEALTCADQPDLLTDRFNCGACGTICTGGRQCVDGNCQCPSGQVFCSGSCVADNGCGGCETLQPPLGATCGTCSQGTRVCASINSTECEGDVTNFCGGCNLPDAVFGDSCGTCGTYACGGGGTGGGGSQQVVCSGGSVDLQNDANNCGSCGNSCQAGLSCVNGQCRCPNDGEQLCNGTCTNLNTSQNCGSCGNTCTGDLTCRSGSCGCSGAPFIQRCGNECYPFFNPNACGNICGKGVELCISGALLCVGDGTDACGTCNGSPASAGSVCPNSDNPTGNWQCVDGVSTCVPF